MLLHRGSDGVGRMNSICAWHRCSGQSFYDIHFCVFRCIVMVRILVTMKRSCICSATENWKFTGLDSSFMFTNSVFICHSIRLNCVHLCITVIYLLQSLLSDCFKLILKQFYVVRGMTAATVSTRRWQYDRGNVRWFTKCQEKLIEQLLSRKIMCWTAVFEARHC